MMQDTQPVRTARPSALSRSTIMMVRRLVHAYREGWVVEGRFAASARMIAEDARLQGIAVESMLVVLKQTWAALDDVWGLPPLEACEILSHLVTLSVRAYFEPSRALRRVHSIDRNMSSGISPVEQTRPCPDARSAA